MTRQPNEAAARPKLSEAQIKEELFEQWLAHPVTAAMMAKAERIQAKCKRRWDETAWATPIDELPAKLSTERLAYLRGKYDAFGTLATLKWNYLLKEEKNDE